MPIATDPIRPATNAPEMEHHDHDDDEQGPGEYVRLALMALVVVASLTGWWKSWMARDWLAFAATLLGGLPIFSEAWENLRVRRMTMELSMTIALLGALGIGQFFTALVIAFFVLFAELIEGMTVDGGRKAIRQLIDSLPRSVTVRRGSEEREFGTHEIARGETIIIKPGERIPCDGVVSKGSSFVDQASITGESMPSEKVEGSSVFAGTVNKNGVLEVTVERIGRDTTFGKIVEVIEEAEQSKAPVQRVADKLAAALVYFALGAALLTFIITHDVVSTIAVIIVAGSCGVAAGTPLAILAGNLVVAPEDADFDGFGAFSHDAGQSGRRASRLSSFTFAPSIRSFSRLASFLAVASCWRRSWFSARRRSHRPTNCATFASRELNSASTPELCCKSATASRNKGCFCK